ncbi:hypothetical protein WOLCODRAFT_89020 [Wolfiporia cocos MD-104 SS10]|uniref:Golgi-body localization protein domain-containing protein n=1 Tax=Wolfiporia cocos (strain MD-104) TaxID=742152 RepID=A0A2H3JTD6_WOLCO|nr:hypothetical protein WOLCODRAFT_89020 [Wolfiporia cocos MD-104 SS10]
MLVAMLSILRALLLAHPVNSSAWVILVLWAVRIVTLSLVFRTYLGPTILRLISKRLRVRSVSLRSIRGIYFRAGSGTWRIDRVGISHHRQSTTAASRFSFKVEGLRLELTKKEDDTLLKPSLTRRTSKKASLTASPLARRVGTAVWDALCILYIALDPYLRPVIRSAFVYALRLVIRALPALTQVLDFELNNAAVTFTAIPGIELAVKRAQIHTKVSLSSLESVVNPASLARHQRHQRHKRFASVADWNARLTNSVRRTWDRAWGATQVTASLSLGIDNVSGTATSIALSDLPIPIPTGNTAFLALPAIRFTASVKIDPHRTIEPHSVETSLRVDAVDINSNVVQHLLKIIKTEKRHIDAAAPADDEEPSFLSPSATSSPSPTLTPLNTRRLTWGSPMSPGSPLMEALSSASSRFRWTTKSSPSVDTTARDTAAHIAMLKAIDFQIGRLTLSHSPPRLEMDVAQTFQATVQDIHFSAGLSHPDTNPMHREWLGSRSVPNDALCADVYRMCFTTGQSSLDRSGSGVLTDRLRVVLAGPLKIESVISQWPSPWFKSPLFLRGDPNAQLLAIYVDLASIRITERLDILHALLSRQKMPTERKTETRSLLPSVLSPMPRFAITVNIGPVITRLISSSVEDIEEPFALEARTEGFTASLSSQYRTVPDRHLRHTLHDHLGLQMDFSLTCMLHRIFVSVCFGSDLNNRRHSVLPSGVSDYPGEGLFALDNFQVSGYGSAFGDITDNGRSVVTLDLPSLFTDVRCCTDAISIELWQPDVIKAIIQTVSLFANTQKKTAPVAPKAPRNILDGLPFGLSISFSVGRFVLFVTAPDLAPEEELGITRGIASHMGISISYCAVHSRHSERINDLLPRSEKRLRLSLPTEYIVKAVAGTTVPLATPSVRVMFGMALWDIALRDAVATRFAADDPYCLADKDANLVSREFLRIKAAEVDVILSGMRPGGSSSPESKDELLVSISVPRIRGTLRLAQIYNILLAIQTLKSLAPPPTEYRPVKKPRRAEAPPLLSVNVQFDLSDLQILFVFPTRTKMFARISYLRAHIAPDKQVAVKWSNAIVAVSGTVVRDGVKREEWDELIRLSDWRVDIPLAVEPLAITVEGDGGRLNIPYDFVLADFILDVNLTVKSARHLVRMVSAGRYEDPPVPEAESAKIVPNTRIRVRCLTVQAADEDIESRLGLIWRTGFEAARIRQERDKAFEAKVSAILAAETHHSASKHRGDSDFHFTPTHSVTVDEARERLYQVHSVAWKSAIARARLTQENREERNARRATGNHAVHNEYEDLVTVNPIKAVPPLFRLTFDWLSVHLSSPSSLADNIPDFLYSAGSGLPRDTEFSLLIPMDISLTLTSLSFTFRDYPLPLLSIPPCADNHSPALSFESHLVIAEEMGTDKSVEWFEAEIVKADSGIHGAAPMMIPIPKTIMPVKTYAQPIIRVLTDNTTDFAWGISYGAASQDLMRIIDTLSHAPKDCSPPIGFWDKLSGAGAGFALCWRGNPRISIGQPNDAGELIQVTSDSMLVIIPNQDSMHTHSVSATSFTNNNPRRARESRVCAKLSSGVCFGVGFVLERSCGPECLKCSGKPFDRLCRLFAFRPHYEVKLETKDNVPELKSPTDSYNGFRSDFVHMSISLKSGLHADNGRSQCSSVHLSPEIFEHFWSFYALFDRALASRKRPISPKFGQHIATLKYRICLRQLFLSHVYVDNSSDAWSDGVTPFVGVKALIDHFEADMHQRDQETTLTTHDIGQPAHHKAFYAIEVVMKNLDLRSLLAVFPESLKKDVQLESSPLVSTYRKDIKAEPVSSDSPWVDPDDYGEPKWPTSNAPTIRLLPAAYCPQFTYFKRAMDPATSSSGTQVVRSKFGGEETHVCSLGREASVTQVQIALAGTRIKELQHRLAHHTSEHDMQRHSHTDCPDGLPNLDSEDVADIHKKITLLNNYVLHLHKVDTASSTTNSHGLHSYHMPSDAVSADEWAEFDNVYQVHSPQIFMDHSVRDVMMQYYYCSRIKRGIEYHMATRAVKFIRDQAQAALIDLLQEPGQSRKSVSGAHAAALAVRHFLGGDHAANTTDEGVQVPLLDAPGAIEPLDGWSEGVSLQKSHFCLLLKPQVVLRSKEDAEPETDSVCVLAAVQGKLKSFAILDDANADDPVSGKIMNRNFASITGLQTFSPSAANKSGDGYVPLEVLIDLRCENNAFDRLVPQTDAFIQYDKFNRLRLRTSATSVAQTSDESHDHLQNHTDLVRVHVPRFTMSANDRHFQFISNIITKLVLFSDAALKDRSDKLEKMLFSYDFTNLGSAADVVADMQARLRHVLETKRQAMPKLQKTGAEGRIELYRIDAHILLLAEELNLIFDAIKLAQDKANDRPEQKSALLLHASSSEISWRMLDRQGQLLAKLAVRDIHFYWLNRQDSSTVNTLVVGDLQAFDGSADAEWTEILSKYDEPGSHPLVKRKLFLLADWTVLPPVGGITIYERFELTFHPMRLQIDSRIGRKIMEYIWPARRHRQNTEDELQTFDLPQESPPPMEESPPPMEAIVVVPDSPTSPRRSSWDVSPRISVDSSKLSVAPTRKLKPSRSFTDLRNAPSESLRIPKLHRTRSTDALGSLAAHEQSAGSKATDDSKERVSPVQQRKEIDDATEMKSRSSQKTFVWVKVSSIAKEGSFLCRDARIRTRDLEYRNQTLSFEELVDQFIPSGKNWRGWVKIAFQQPLVPVLPVARELISKTKWIPGKTHHVHDEHPRSNSPSLLLPFHGRHSNTSSSTSSTATTSSSTSTLDLKRQRTRSLFQKRKNQAPIVAEEVTAEPEPLGAEGNSTNDAREKTRPRVLSVFKRKQHTVNNARSSMDSGISTSSVDMISLEGSQTDVLVPAGRTEPGRVGSALSVPRSEESRFDWVGEHHPDDIVEYLDVIDPQIATVATLTNAANAIVIPPLDFYSRKPVVVLPRRRRKTSRSNNAEKGQAQPDEDEDNLDSHVEDVLRKRDRMRRVMQGIWSFVKTPIYGFLVVFWGTALVFFLARFIDLHNDNTQGFWVELCQQIETGLFSVTSIGLAPFRVVDTYRMCKIWWYQRRTDKLRREAGLPELYDPDDLPDPHYDANYVPVLTEQEQINLHYLANLAFPINIALWICVMNDLNTLFQCLLSGCMWSMNRFQRPAWTTATTLPLAFVAGIVAGFLIYWGGRKTKRVKEVTERLRMALATERRRSEVYTEADRPTVGAVGDGGSCVPKAAPVSESLEPSEEPQWKDFAHDEKAGVQESVAPTSEKDRASEAAPRTPATPMPVTPGIHIADEMIVPPADVLEDEYSLW